MNNVSMTVNEKMGLTEEELKAEKEFREKVEEVAYYQGDKERVTLDGEWTEEELRGDVEDEVSKLLNGTNVTKGWIENHKFCVLKNPDLTHVEFLVNAFCDENDLIEVYNTAVDEHRNDSEKLFGIHYFDQKVRAKLVKMLSENLAAQE